MPADTDQADNDVAVNHHEGTEKQAVDDEVTWDNSKWEEPFDEEGNPYFDSLDSDQFTRLFTKYAEEHKGLMDEKP